MRIATYNTRGSLGSDGLRSTKRIAETLRPFSADVICFQEIYQRIPPPLEDQPAKLEALLNRSFVFQRCLDFAFGGYGNGIAASTNGEVREHTLPSGKEQRGALEVRLRGIGRLSAVTIFCTHWGLDADERKLQSEALANLVNAAPRPVVVCGDLNEEFGGAAVRALIARAGLIDADAGGNRPTFPAGEPRSRIDYVLHSPDLRATYLEVVRSDASDHLPVVADLSSCAIPA
ncbi:MAG TPA: endonuclease/exonuclease/phosphatase family protein [Chthonomonadaceae bacterium]|nr:endonuclease/exonuclease/phosphatase family protein [Chthonomonadaceae bacterium]